MSTSQRKYDENFKKSIVTLHQNGKTQTQLAKEYGISLTAISRWVKQYSEIKID
ncbi:helix-turn-helix domain-containing protein, partial [Acetivibrio sp. MSJd-27]|uniref:helix-turn-helix domain-containing protein n=1 Tax=Acetivibrio sp. MSJd-27 TaxID=2841523 RepID=UPI001C0F63EB|nr:helix-turn-helix domain containing protein [Acetivibrio sp. MSJd-27]